MTSRAAALVLVWAGAVLLALVVGVRARSGAWSETAFDQPPPVPRWTWPIVTLGLLLTAAGAVVLVRSFV